MAEQTITSNVVTLIDEEGNSMYPETSTYAVLDASGNTLDQYIDRLINGRLQTLEEESVMYTEQDKEDIQKQQARYNIGAASIQQLGELAENLSDINDNTVKSTMGIFSCPTNSGEPLKIITMDNDSEFSPIVGASFKIRFRYGNTANSVQLQFGNNTSSKRTLYFNDRNCSDTNTWGINDLVTVWYDGSIYYAYPTKLGIDKEPMENSENLVESGGVYKAINDMFVYDNTFDHVPTKYELNNKYANKPIGCEVYVSLLNKLYKKLGADKWGEITLSLL